MKQFHIGDILSVTSGKLLSPRGIGGVYDILNYMTGDNLFTHQLPRAAKECAPSLLKQFPWAAAFTGELGVTPGNFDEYMSGLVHLYGEMHPVIPLTEHEHEFIDPVSELAEKRHPDTILVLSK